MMFFITPSFERMLRTVSEGCAPLDNQSKTKSSFKTTSAGSFKGLWVPTVSMKRPSRGERESATTIR